MSARDADAIELGAGAAGMMGALAAGHGGANVLLLEKDLSGPSNLLVSGGLFPGAGTRWQRESGLEDDAAAFARDIRAKGRGTANEAIVDAVAGRCADAAHFLADVAGIPVHTASAFQRPATASRACMRRRRKAAASCMRCCGPRSRARRASKC